MTYAIVDVTAELSRLPRRSRARKVLEGIARREMTERLIMDRLDADIAAIVDLEFSASGLISETGELHSFPLDGGML